MGKILVLVDGPCPEDPEMPEYCLIVTLKESPSVIPEGLWYRKATYSC